MTLVLAVWLAAGIGGPVVSRTVSNVSLSSAALIAAAMCFLKVRRVTGRMRLSWMLVGSGMLSWGLGQLVWTWYESILGREVPFPSLADVGYLGLPVFTAAGLLALPVRSQNAAQRIRSVLDGLMIAGSMLLVSWLLVLGPIIDTGSDSAVNLVISLAYPVSDVVIVTIVLFMLALGRQAHVVPMPLLLVGAGLVTFAIADSGFAYLTLTGAYSSGAVIDVGWFAGFLLIVLAALKPARERLAVAEPVAGRSFGLLLPYLAVLAAVATSMIELVRTGHTDSMVSWNRSAILLLLVGRQVLTLLENRSLTRGLEARVADRTARLRASEQRFEALVQHSSDVVTVVDTEAVVLYQSKSIDRVFGHRAEALTGKPLTTLLDERAADLLREALSTVASRPYGTLSIELPLARADGRVCDAEILITNLLDDPNIAAMVLNTRDVTERRGLENQLVHEAFHDSLTSLANRVLFKDRVEQALRHRHGDKSRVAVLFLDLDGFKEVNDSQGHAAGDELLITVAQRLRDSVRPEDTVARFGGDEFAILVNTTDPDELVEAAAVAERILARIKEPFIIEHRELHVRASIGIATPDLDAENADQLMRNADLAMYRAKATGGAGYTTYHQGMHTALVDRLQLETDLRRGLGDHQFELQYQPTVDLDSGTIVGFEALVRWNHPTRGVVLPAEFISVAEASGFIRPLGEWVLREACRQAAVWIARENRPLTMSVNVSGRQLDQPAFLQIVEAALTDSGLAPNRLCLEMTESVLLVDTDEVLALLNELKKLGVRLAIDDFGTGYSSLSYLHRFPFDILKIDKSFIDQLNSRQAESTLVRTIVQLGQGLGVTTIAEGLEHFDQFLVLRRMGCQVGQGFYFSRPVPAEQAGELLLADHPSATGPRDSPTSRHLIEVPGR